MFDAPFYYVSMPINKNGDGPCDKEDAVRILHEVWSSCEETVCECPDEETAKWLADRLNGTESGTDSDDGQPDEAKEWQDYDPDC